MEGNERARKRLAKSLLEAGSYPKMVERTHKSAYALAAYRDRLEKDEAAIFIPNEGRRAIFFWDLADNNGGEASFLIPEYSLVANSPYLQPQEFQLQPKVSTLEQLKALINVDSDHPRSRFMYESVDRLMF
jgi:hypothetical protein